MNTPSLHPVETLVSAALDEHPCNEVWVGFSGGVDSTALLLACQSVLARRQQPPSLHALHVNHALQDNAAAFAAHCAGVCAERDIDFVDVAVSVDPRGNLEANARAARYDCFARHLGPGALLMLGHHEHDQAETVLYRLFEGRGLLPMRTHGQVGAGRFVRPLLSLNRDAVVAYVRSLGVAWIEDDSNADVRFTRNFLRHDIIPSLAARWRNLHTSVVRVAARHADTHAALHSTLSTFGDTVALKRLPPAGAVRQMWLRVYLQTRGVFAVSDKALREFDQQLSSAVHAQLDCADATLHGYAGRLYFESVTDVAAVQTHLLEPGGELRLANGSLSLRAARPGTKLAFVCAGALEVRFRSGGEQLRPAARARTRSLKKLFVDAQVPPWQRAQYPLLYWDGELVCVPGLAVNVDAAGMSSVADPADARGDLYHAIWRPHETHFDRDW